MPKLVTSTMTKSLRAGKVFVDWSQNSAVQDHDRAVFAARARAPDGRRAAHLGGTRRSRPAPAALSTRCWTGWRATAICWPRSTPTMPLPDRLTTYRSMRDAAKTPSRCPQAKPAVGNNNTFVIQEHHARRLHYDFRLERDGVLVSWAVPEEPAGDHVGQPPRGAHRGSSAGVRDVRGQHPEGGVRRRQGDHLGLGHLRDREVPGQSLTAGRAAR